MTAADARRVAEEVGHPVWLWDNYPVNDWNTDGISAYPLHTQAGLDNLVIPRRLSLTPIADRDPGLADTVCAIGSNLALDPWTGLPAALSMLDFATEGATFDSTRSWGRIADALDVDGSALAILADSAGP